MTDAVLAVRAGVPADDVGGALRLGGHDLVEVLEHDSWMCLRAAVDAVAGGQDASRDHLVLFTRDGRTLEADVVLRLDAVAIELHDVTRHVDEADRFARLAMQLHRRNRDLQTLYDATARLGETLDVQALVDTTAAVLADYLRARGVVVTAAGHEALAGRPGDADETTRLGATTLTTVRGDLGTVAWWRASDLTEDERRVLDVVRHRAAVSIDHALLLAPPPSAGEHDEHGLLAAATARRRLAGFARPFALALVDHGGDLAGLADRIRGGRAGDVKAPWGRDRVLIALAGAGEEQLRAWLRRAGVVSDDVAWRVGIVRVDDDVEASIQAAAEALVAPHDGVTDEGRPGPAAV